MKTFTKNFRINAELSDVYAALTNPVTIELWSGYPAVMSEEPGSEFSLWEGDIEGRNISFEKNRKIVQEWYFGDQSVKSVVTITLKQAGSSSTDVNLEHVNIPDEVYENIVQGWDDYYFGAIQNFFNPNF
ncbi:MAG TPA: SRPBCC domain-containing protein [Bacteroidales bacterium]|nr:SRPBCC domain-containing protein [Bacteroidales bacterium]HRR94233.1 SRPBCC domain-containing protein [Bacteroidales bacterium]HRT89903.1 SRPBCC domain-containing protein [Bacteroidales bacterium]